MAVSAEQFAAELRAFDGRRQVVKALRRALGRAARPAVKATRAYATAVLPHSGGLGAWVADARIGWKIGYTGRTAGVRLRGGRRSLADRSDLKGIDAGKVRHPTYGNRGRGMWHGEAVTSGWWTTPLTETPEWSQQADSEVDKALDDIRRG